MICVRGEIDEGDINASSPVAVSVVRTLQVPSMVAGVERAARHALPATMLVACCDQSGLIGLLRHLHGLGFVLLSVSRVEAADSSEPSAEWYTLKAETKAPL